MRVAFAHIMATMMLLSMVFLSVSECILWSVYTLNKEQIAKELCVNVTDPCCQGSCFVEQATQGSQNTSSSTSLLSMKIELPPGVLSSLVVIPQSETDNYSSQSFAIEQRTLAGYPQAVYHPPIV